MDEHGQIYFGPEDEIPDDDLERYRRAIRDEELAGLRKQVELLKARAALGQSRFGNAHRRTDERQE